MGWGKSGPIATFDLIFLGFGWPWVGEFVGFIIMFTWYMFSNPTEFGISQTPCTENQLQCVNIGEYMVFGSIVGLLYQLITIWPPVILVMMFSH